MDSTHEQNVIKSCREDLSNFTEIYNVYVKDVYRYVYSRLNNQTETEDITSETFLKALEKLETFQIQEGKSIKCWLFTIARNMIYDKYRKKELVEFDEEYTAWSDENILEKAVNKDMIKRVEDFIQKFNPPVPEIIQLRIWEELSFEEISDVMGKPVGSIKMAYYRALEKIHSEFMKEGATINGK